MAYGPISQQEVYGGRFSGRIEQAQPFGQRFYPDVSPKEYDDCVLVLLWLRVVDYCRQIGQLACERKHFP